MEFGRYLRLMGNLYFQGATSNFHPDLLARFGGSLTICAGDVRHIRIDPDSMLGMERRMQDRWTAAQVGWRRHAAQIRTLLEAGQSPSDAIYQYCARFRTTPHRPAQLELALAPVMMTDGSSAHRWQVETLELRRRIARGGAVMTDTFGAIATMGALMMTATDWRHATPAEWDRAMNAGEVAIVLGAMAGAHTDAHQQRRDVHESVRPAH